MISICIPCYRGAERLARLLGSLLLAGTEVIEEIIIVDDGSPAFEAAQIQDVATTAAFKHLRIRPVVVLPQNRGPVEALKVATNRARGDLVLQLDDDLVLPPRFLSTAERLFAIPNLGVLSWRSQGPNPGQSLHPAVGFLEPATEIAGYCMMYPRDALDEVGGIDTRFKFYCSDSDFALRVALLGRPCYRVWWPLVPHDEHKSIDDARRHELARIDLAAFRDKWGADGKEMERRALARFRGEST